MSSLFSPILSRALSAVACLAVTAGLTDASAQGFSDGAVYTSTNESTGNQVAVFPRAADGSLGSPSFFATGGLGTDGGLGNQGAVTLSDDGRFLYVVNAGSDELSVFAVLEEGLELIDVASTRGERPVSVDQHDNLVYVLNAGNDTVAGFRQRPDGRLRSFGGRRRLSGQGVAAAQLGFSNDGRFVYVTERSTNLISRFRVAPSGALGSHDVMDSAGVTPFGFHVGQRNQLIVSEAAGGAAGASTASSYTVDATTGDLAVVSAAVPTGESAACWVIGTPDGRLAFVTNTADDTVSSYAVGFDGDLSVLEAQAVVTGDGPTDAALTADGLFLYVLAGADDAVGAYGVGFDGGLTPRRGELLGADVSPTGLAAR